MRGRGRHPPGSAWRATPSRGRGRTVVPGRLAVSPSERGESPVGGADPACDVAGVAVAAGAATAALILGGEIADSPRAHRNHWTRSRARVVADLTRLLEWRRRPDQRTGPLMVFFGFAWFGARREPTHVASGPRKAAAAFVPSSSRSGSAGVSSLSFGQHHRHLSSASPAAAAREAAKSRERQDHVGRQRVYRAVLLKDRSAVCERISADGPW